MKNSFFNAVCKTRYLALLVVLIFTCGNVWGATAKVDDFLWREQFTGTTTSTSTTFSASTAATISALANSSKGTSMLDNSDISGLSYTASNVMVTASTGANCSGAHIWVNKKTTGYFQVTGIPVYNATKIKILWNQGGGSSCTASYKLDNGSWTSAKTTTSAGADISSNEISVSGKTTISIKFTRTSTNTNIRLDDLRIKVTEVAATGTSVSLTKAATTNGSFTLSPASSVTTTSSAQTVTVTCSPDPGYYVSSVSATNPATGTATPGGSGNARTVEYSSGANGTSTISVTFSPIWYLKGDFNSWGTTDPLTDITSNVATVTKSLSKTTAYEFKVYNAQTDAWYGNNGKIIDDISGWVFSTSENNCTVFATVADDYTFNFNISNQQMQVVYPDMTHPNDAYVYLTNWWDCYVHYWYTDGEGDHPLIDWGYDTQLSRHEEICGTDYWCVPILDGYPKLIMKDNAGDPSNTTGDQTTNSNAEKYITHNGVSWGWHDFATYTISYAGGGGTGAMSSHTDLCPGSSQTLTTNSFTKTNYTFTGWVANVDVKIGGSTVTAGTLIANTATIQDIQGNITLTAQWVHVPVITVSKTSIAFGDKKVGGSYQETFTVSGSYLTANIGLAISGANPTLFSVDKTTLTPSAGSVATTTITVTWTPSAAYNAATITINSTGATSKTVNLSGTGKWEVTWINNGSSSTTLVASGTKPTFPSTPESCDDESTTFYGWSTSSWTGKLDDVSAKTIYTSSSAMPNVSANGTIYYAVFMKSDIPVGAAAVNTVMWAETFAGYSANNVPSGSVSYSHTGTTVYNSGSVTYACANGTKSNTKIYNESLAGGTAPELLVGGKSTEGDAANGKFTVTNIPKGGASELTLSFIRNQSTNGMSVTVSGTGYSIEKVSGSGAGTYVYTITCGSATTFGIVFNTVITSNIRLDNIEVKVKTQGGTNSKFLTNCCDKNVTLAHNSPSNGTVTFSPAGPIATCSATAADRQTTMTITPNAGYKLTSWSTTGVTPASVSPAVATSGDDSKSAQAITVTFTQNTTTGTYTANATFTAMVDHFIDKLHETTGYTESDNHAESAKYTVPNLSDKSAPSDETCEQLHYKFVGWVAADDVDSDGTLIGSPTILTGGTTNHPASDKTYWAIWAKEL